MLVHSLGGEATRVLGGAPRGVGGDGPHLANQPRSRAGFWRRNIFTFATSILFVLCLVLPWGLGQEGAVISQAASTILNIGSVVEGLRANQSAAYLANALTSLLILSAAVVNAFSGVGAGIIGLVGMALSLVGSSTPSAPLETLSAVFSRAGPGWYLGWAASILCLIRPRLVRLAEKTRRVEIPVPPQPLDPFTEVITRLRVQVWKLRRISDEMSARGRGLFEKCVQAEAANDPQKAAAYAGELAEVRRLSGVILKAQISFEHLLLRLETVKEFDSMRRLLPQTMAVVKEVQSELSGKMPQVAGDLASLNESLETLTVEMGEVEGAVTEISAQDEDAQAILKEAGQLATERMKESFPELPEKYKAPEMRRG